LLLAAGIIITIKYTKPDGTQWTGSIEITNPKKDISARDQKPPPPTDRAKPDRDKLPQPAADPKPELTLDGAGQHVCFSHDGKRIFAASRVNPPGGGPVKCVARIYSDRGAPAAAPLENLDIVYAIAASRDGKWHALSGGYDTGPGQLLLRAEDIRQPIRLRGHEGEVGAIAFSPDSKLLASAGKDAVIRLWDLEDRPELKFELRGHERGPVLAFHPSKRLLASAGIDRLLIVWDLKTKKQVEAVRMKEQCSGVAYTPDGTQIVTASPGGILYFWDADTLKVRKELTRKGLPQQRHVRFTPDGRYLLSSDLVHNEPNWVHVWDVEKKTVVQEFPAHDYDLTSMALSFDGKRLLTTSEKGEAKLWNMADLLPQSARPPTTNPRGRTSPKPEFVFNGPRCGCLSADGEWLFGSVDVQKDGPLKSREVIHSLADKPEPEPDETLLDDVDTMKASPDGKWRALAGGYDTGPGNLLLRTEAVRQPIRLRGHDGGRVHQIAFSLDSKRLASSGQDRIIRVWSLEKTPRQEFELPGPHEGAAALAFHPRENQLAGIPGGYRVAVWDLKTKQRIASSKRTREEQCGLAYSPGGSLIVTAGADGILRLWDSDTLEPRGEITRTALPRQSHVLFTRDGRHIVSADCVPDTENWVHVWDVKEKTLVHEFRAHATNITAMDLSLDGKRLLTTSEDKKAKIWKMADLIPDGD
jgi:WD40 repeat protein